MRNYAPILPRDKDNESLQEFPSAKRPETRYSSDNASVSSVISLTHDTTVLEIAAVGNSAVIRWVATSDTQASIISGAGGNFDHVIPQNYFRRFVVPRESFVQTAGSIQGINRENGLFQRVAIKSIGVASILLAEF